MTTTPTTCALCEQPGTPQANAYRWQRAKPGELVTVAVGLHLCGNCLPGWESGSYRAVGIQHEMKGMRHGWRVGQQSAMTPEALHKAHARHATPLPEGESQVQSDAGQSTAGDAMTAIVSKRIDQDVRDVLATIEWDGTAAKLTCGTLDRKLYLKTNAVLESIGGKWNKKAKAHLFESEGSHTALEGVIETGVYFDLKDLRDVFGEFPTPDELAETLVEKAIITSGLKILEPSAGGGQLIKAMHRKAAHARGLEVLAIEIQGKHQQALLDLGCTVHIADFLTVEPVAMFDRVVMNPPFANQADIDHVLHAWQFVKPGGRLVAIMSPGFTFRTNKKSVAFKALVDEHGAWQSNPEGSFKVSGTGVNTVIVTLDKPAVALPGDGQTGNTAEAGSMTVSELAQRLQDSAEQLDGKTLNETEALVAKIADGGELTEGEQAQITPAIRERAARLRTERSINSAESDTADGAGETAPVESADMSKKTSAGKKPAGTKKAAVKAAVIEVKKDAAGRFWLVPKSGNGKEVGPFETKKEALAAKAGKAPAAKAAKGKKAKKAGSKIKVVKGATAKGAKKAKTAKAPKAAKPKSDKPKHFGLLDAAIQVLNEHNGKAFNAKEQFELIEKAKLWKSPSGKTPIATLEAALARELKKDSPRVAKPEPGKFIAVKQAKKAS